MANLMPGDIADEVTQVLLGAARGKGAGPCFLTAYQVLDRLPQATRDRLIAERTLGGTGSGVSYAAPSVVSDAAERLPGIEISWVDTRGLSLRVAGQPVSPGYEICALYRIASGQ